MARLRSLFGFVVGLTGVLSMTSMPAHAADVNVTVTCVAGINDMREVTVPPGGLVDVSWSGCTWMRVESAVVSNVAGPVTVVTSDADQTAYSIPSAGKVTITTTDTLGGWLVYFATGAPGTFEVGPDGRPAGGTALVSVERPPALPARHCVTTNNQGEKYDNCWKPRTLPKIVGSMSVGSTVRVTMGVWKPHVYWWSPEWYRVMPDGTLKSVGTKLKYKLTRADKGLKIVVLVNAYHQNYEGHVYTKPRLVG